MEGQADRAVLNGPFENSASTLGNDSQTQQPGMNTQSGMVLGEFSFAPTTETTVYTTKVVKTINFPPLLMKGPKHLHDLDPKLYPLAASPTPPALKKFCFDVGGKPTVFREAEDPQATLQEIREQTQQLRESGGKISTRKGYGGLETPQRVDSGLSTLSQDNDNQISINVPLSPSRVPSGVRTRGSQIPSTKSSRVTRRYASTNQADFPRPSKSASRLQYVQTSTPITPSLTTRKENEKPQELEPGLVDAPSPSSPSAEKLTPDTQGRDIRQTLSPQPEVNMEQSFSLNSDYSSMDEMMEDAANKQIAPSTQTSYQTSVGSSYRPRPSALDTAAAQDASLPSPSLSPVTAAANMQSRRSYFDDMGSFTRRSTDENQSLSRISGMGLDELMFTPQDTPPNHKSSLMDIPRLLDTFEAMPVDMQRYVMFQLLRRCPKPVLHSVADTVNPALKCDFLALLPTELGHLIISHLDLRSLCRASQVSKKWREIIDLDEKIWKNLLIAAGYEFSSDEMKRAILEGWGWQPFSGIADAEEDLGNFDASADNHPSPSMASVVSASDTSSQTQTTGNRRSKRKVGTRGRTASRKASKKKENESDEVALYDVPALTKHIKSNEGPYAAAKAAITAVPSAHLGLPNLRNLTLHKNIYRRHHLISNAWMQDEVKPRHLAFKAHSRHVVTCLQFDADKILTGSDDTNINVYDTKTGALRAKLEGHEGGVWALQYVGNTLVSGSTDRSVRIWDIEGGICTHVFPGHTSTVRCLIILMPAVIGKTASGRPIMMPKEPMVITGSRDSTLRVWKLPKEGDAPTGLTGNNGAHDESPYFCRALTGHIHSVRAIAAHGDTLVSGSYDCSVRVWKISTGETLLRLNGHAQKVYSVVLDHERNRCISGSMDNIVKIWSLENGACLHNLEGHSSLVGLLDLQRDRLVSAAADSTLRIWDPVNGRCESVLSAHTGAITCFQHDGKKVVSGSDRNLKMWDIKTGAFVRDLLTELSCVWQVNFDERRCVAAVQRNNLTYIEILDFGASRDGVPPSKRGRRIVVDARGHEIVEVSEAREQNDADE